MAEKEIRHGIDNDPYNDTKKGAELGGIGGAVTGAVAGSAVGPVGTVIGGVVGAVVGAVASGAAVHEVDKHDNDNTISGIGETRTHTSRDNAEDLHEDTEDFESDAENRMGGNGVPGVQTGGHDVDGTPDSRGIMEKTADAVTGDHIDDKTGKRVR